MGKKDCQKKPRSRTSSSSSEECNEEHLKKLYDELKMEMLKDKTLQIAGSDAYGSFYSLSGQQVNAAEPVIFEYSQTRRNIDLGNGKQTLFIRRDGVYQIILHVTPDGASQWTLFVNDMPQFDRIFGTFNSGGQVTITYLIALRDGDLLTFRNYVSDSPAVTVSQIIGGLDPGANCEVVLEKIAPYPEKKHCKCPAHQKHHEVESDKKEHKHKKQFEILKKWLKYDPALMVNGCDCYGSFYSSITQDVAVDAPVLFEKSTNVYNMTHTLGSGDIVVQKAGIYLFVLVVECT